MGRLPSEHDTFNPPFPKLMEAGVSTSSLISIGEKIIPVSYKPIGDSAMPGKGDSTSAMRGGAIGIIETSSSSITGSSTGSTSSIETSSIGSSSSSTSDSGAGSSSGPLISKPSYFIFIIPHVTNMNTMVCRSKPEEEGQPVGPDTHFPRIRRISRYMLGLAMIKKVRAAMKEMASFFSCFLPSQPHPQSLKIPIVILIYSEKKNLLKVWWRILNTTNQQCPL